MRDNCLSKETQRIYPSVRPALCWWAEEMENRLRAKDKSHEQGWLNGNLQHYITKIFGCWSSAVRAIQFVSTVIVDPDLPSKVTSGIKDHDDITGNEIDLATKKCVDGANFFMMLADNLENILLEREK